MGNRLQITETHACMYVATGMAQFSHRHFGQENGQLTLSISNKQENKNPSHRNLNGAAFAQ